MHKKFLFIAAVFGSVAVIMGAFAAHGLKKILTADNLQVFETAVRYQMYHVFALLVAGILYQSFPGKLLQWAGTLFIIGIILFSGSLYFLCYLKFAEIQSGMWVGAITPFGGLCFISAWLLVAAAVVKKQ